ncbi:MAG: hypothetical protein P9M14_01820 [Candidatus Alcyoniella australis]|nr:hypothetical protein [Candidatus Alcyoniella australis]
MYKPAALIVALLLIACLPAAALPPVEHVDSPPFKISTRVPESAGEGELVKVVFEITNKDSQPHVLYDIQRKDYPWTVYTFQRTARGALEVDHQQGGYNYDPGARGTTERFFSEGLIWPGQTIAVEVKYRPLQMREEFQLRWYQFCACAVDRLFWVPQRLSTAPGEPLEQYDPEDSTSFVHINAPAQQRLRAAQSRTVSPADTPSQWAVIFPAQRLGELLFKSGDLGVRHPVARRDPNLSKALSQVTTRPDNATFSFYYNAWVLCYPSHCVLIRSDGSLENVPTREPALFDDLDNAGSAVVQVESWDDQLKRAFEVRKGDGVHTVGQFVEVPRQRLDELFSYARERGLLIKLHPVGLEGHYFFLEGER